MAQHLPVHGYVDQSEASIGFVNQNKITEEQLLRVIDVLASDPDIDQRWLAIGKTHLEQAFMCINRAILKPQRVELEKLAPGAKAQPEETKDG